MAVRHSLKQRNVGPTALRRRRAILHSQDNWPKAETLVDALNIGTISASNWPIQYGAVSSGAGGLTVAPPLGSTTYGGVQSGAYDLTGSHVLVKLPNVGNQSLTSWEIYVAVFQDGTHLVQFYLNADSLLAMYANDATGGFPSAIGGTTYDPVQHQWLRIRESGGQTFWETSPDSITWTFMASVANPIDTRRVTVELQAGTFASEASATSATWEFLNFPQAVELPADATAVGTAFAPTVVVNVLPAAATASGTAFAPSSVPHVLPVDAPAVGTAFAPSIVIKVLPTTASATGVAGVAVARAFGSPSKLRMFTVPPDNRTVQVPIDSRKFYVPADTRSVVVQEG